MNKPLNIKLVTFFPHPNFGTCLQSYALNYVLKEMGHDVEFIYNRHENPPISLKEYLKQICKRILPDCIVVLLKQKRATFSPIATTPYILTLPNNRILYLFSKLPGTHKLYKRFMYDNLQKRKVYKFTFEDGNYKTRRIFTHKQYEDIVKDADLFITGSDQIWNPFCGGYNPMMFLEFVNDGTKCIAYSSSISQQTIHPIIKQRVKTALQKFTHIAVREQHSVELLNHLLERNDVKLVVDPTYLLTPDEWTIFGSHAVLEFELPKKYIFCYFVGDKRADVYERMVQDVKSFTGIKEVITLDCYNRELIYGGGRLYKDAGPYEWVYLLQNSSYVCMDSFHATVFALKFEKEFVHAMKNDDSEIGSQNTRMYDILNRYDILYKNYNDNGDTSWQNLIDYKKVTHIINAEIEDSLDFLKKEIIL